MVVPDEYRHPHGTSVSTISTPAERSEGRSVPVAKIGNVNILHDSVINLLVLMIPTGAEQGSSRMPRMIATCFFRYSAATPPRADLIPNRSTSARHPSSATAE
ncbi:hypothetical protein GCM10027562_01820 [Arthrobacter pigmenti]